MSDAALPILGASFAWNVLDQEIDWLNADGRDLEVGAGHTVLDDDWKDFAAQARKRFEGFKGRLSIHAPGGVRTATADPLEREFTRNRFRQAIAFAAEIGATHMVVEPWLFTFSNACVIPEYMPRLQDISYDTLAPVVADAEKAGVTLVMENVPEVMPHVLIDLIRRFDSPSARMCLDTGHAYLMHRQHGAPTPDVWVREAGSLLAHVHMADNDGQMDRHWAPGDGSIVWYMLFEAFNKLETMPRLILELPPERARRGVAYLGAAGFAR